MSASHNPNIRIRDTRPQPKKRQENNSLSLDGLIMKIDSLLPEVDGETKESVKKEIS